MTTQVHVWAPPEAALERGERLCSDPDRDEVVVFHCEPVTFMNGERMCLACASIFWQSGKAKPDRRGPA